MPSIDYSKLKKKEGLCKSGRLTAVKRTGLGGVPRQNSGSNGAGSRSRILATAPAKPETSIRALARDSNGLSNYDRGDVVNAYRLFILLFYFLY